MEFVDIEIPGAEDAVCIVCSPIAILCEPPTLSPTEIIKASDIAVAHECWNVSDTIMMQLVLVFYNDKLLSIFYNFTWHIRI